MLKLRSKVRVLKINPGGDDITAEELEAIVGKVGEVSEIRIAGESYIYGLRSSEEILREFFFTEDELEVLEEPTG